MYPLPSSLSFSLVRVEDSKSNSKHATRKSRTHDKRKKNPRNISAALLVPSRAGEMAGMSRAIRNFAAASRRTLTAASGPALPKEAAAAGARVRAAAPGRMGRDQEDGRRVQWVFLGCPGVGKGTYASRLSQLLGVPHIATGDLVRDALATPGPFSNKLAEIVNHGKLVSDEIIINLLSRRLEEGEEKGELGFILDGFPRTIGQAVS
ncbi:Adenylate kinase 1 chloroplastic [Zea mays]|uniref:adenylate kinase n=2 Tax=Zea mays TaxID=4577 RepID=A0A1D6JHN4_MAIZE|nr:Adenylate kinase 1 chloroplastic [Zea mays]